VLALGILSVVIPLAIIGLAPLNQRIGQAFMPMGAVTVPLGIAGLVLGSMQLRGMRRHRVDTAGRVLARTGQVLGSVGALGWVAFTGFVLISINSMLDGATFQVVGGDYTRQEYLGNLRLVTTCSEGCVTGQWEETQAADGSWVKNGTCVLRSCESSVWTKINLPSIELTSLGNGRASEHERMGRKTEAGRYRDGKREGQWTFWNADGTIDESRSGIYENDVRVQPGPTQPGDYPTEKLRMQRLDSRPPR
jgi:hypothetical protein